MQGVTSVAIEEGLTQQLTDDMTRLLAGTTIRQNGSEITGVDLQQMIQELLGAGGSLQGTQPTIPVIEFDNKSVAPDNFEPTKEGVNKDSSSKGMQEERDAMRSPDTAMPDSLKSLTGSNTVGEFIGNTMSNLAFGALTAVNPVAGIAAKGLVNVMKGVDPLDTIADIFAGMNPVTSIGKTVMNAVGLYDEAEGMVSSTVDAAKTLNNADHVPTTLAGRNVINAQVEREKAETGHYDSSRSSQQRASTAALNRDNAPAYARPGYGTALSEAKNPAKSAPAKGGGDRSYQSAGGIGKTDSSKGHAPAGGVGPSPGGKQSSGNGGGGGSKGGSSGSSSSSGGGNKGNGKSGSGSYGGR